MPIHLKQMQQLLDRAKEHGQLVDVYAWEKQSGEVIHYDGWQVSSSSWRGGWHRLVHPKSHQIRTVPDILIFKVNGEAVYL